MFSISNRLFLIRTALSFLFLAVSFTAGAQSIVETDLGTQPASALVQNLLGTGVAFSNVVYQGIGASSGTFTGGNGIIGFDSGIILSTGLAASVVGPNTNDASNCNSLPGDQDLANLAGTTLSGTQDATVLSFDFVPSFDTISFQYVFASDEYNEFVGSYNDVFGFFVNGTNEALIPGTSTIVSIDNVNNCSNPSYFIDNSNGQTSPLCAITRPSANLNTSMYGLTTVLTVNAAVTPGVTNHIKMAICDVVDCELDSNVFIRANSFFSGATPTETPTPSNTPTVTATSTYTITPSNTPTFTPTSTPTATYTSTATPTATPTATFTQTETYTPTCVLHVWPDPFNPRYAFNGTLKFGCLPTGAVVSIYTLSGEWVNDVSESGGLAQWKGNNQVGFPVSEGAYYYVIKSGNEVLGKGKFLVMR